MIHLIYLEVIDNLGLGSYAFSNKKYKMENDGTQDYRRRYALVVFVQEK